MFIGFVTRDSEGRLASHVRAVGVTGSGELLNCGTANVTTLDNSNLGFYRITVVSDEVREGCPDLGAQVRFRLLYGRVDEGVDAIANRDTTFVGGNTSAVSLTPTPQHAQAATWAGEASGSVASLTWLGDPSTPAADALADLGRPVVRAWQWDAESRRFLVYVPGGPPFLQTLQVVDAGDVVHVRFQ
ncbi:MAG: hypothetical protein O2822_06130 [Chloroflexi bacterium]|nr:hypothetical protein [Chloroflexota bacterium]